MSTKRRLLSGLKPHRAFASSSPAREEIPPIPFPKGRQGGFLFSSPTNPDFAKALETRGLTCLSLGGTLHTARQVGARAEGPGGSTLLVDIHTHTYPRSDDSFIAADDLVEAAKAKGLDGLCVTEHDVFWDPADTLALSRRHDFLVLPGCEVNTDSGHVLVFGLEKYVFGMHHLAFLRGLVERAGGVMVAAHPYRRRYQPDQAHNPEAYGSMVESACADELFSVCEAIEALNGRAREGETRFSMDMGDRLVLRMTGGSDAHRLDRVGDVATRFHGNISCLDDFIEEIKAGRYEPAYVGKGSTRMEWTRG